MMTKKEAIAAIEDIGWQESRPGLERTFELLEKFGNPQNDLKFIHVAGSNGKGSSCAMFDAILRAAGYHCGLYTSPYIQDFCERIRIDGENISGDDLSVITEKVMTTANEMADHPTQFELITTVAMIYFKKKKTDIVVLETGMGGALDSTNVIPAPELACLTNICLEHTEFLGDTLEAIAKTKGGIIKPGCTCICYPSDPKAVKVIQSICEEKKVPFEPVQQIHIPYRLNLIGEYQKKNAALVLTGIDALRQRGWIISEQAVEQGLATVSWPARMEVLWKKPLFILDGGHNPQCVYALKESLDILQNTSDGQYISSCREKRFSCHYIFLTGVLADKDYPVMMAAMLPIAKSFVCLTPDSPRALPAEKLAVFLQNQGAEAIACQSVEEGIIKALQLAGNDGIICFGSLYMAGGVRTAFLPVFRQYLRKKYIAARNGLSPEVHRIFSAKAVERLVSTDIFKTAKIIMIYRAVKNELSLETLIKHPLSKGKIFCYPVCQKGHTMAAYVPCGEEDWTKGFCSIPEPVLKKSYYVEPDKIDLIVCPCSGFDADGNRMGMGGGYYDRFLEKLCHPRVCAIAFELQRIDSIPISEKDVPMDFIVTEKNIYQTKIKRSID